MKTGGGPGRFGGMSKAFTKDEGEAVETDLTIDPLADLPPGTRNYMTTGGVRAIEIEASTTRDPQRLWTLRRILESAVPIDPVTQSGDRVVFGASVRIRDEEGEERVYRIVGLTESDVRRGRVSWLSPIGKALLQKRVGDLALLRTPGGEEELEILAITFEPL